MPLYDQLVSGAGASALRFSAKDVRARATEVISLEGDGVLAVLIEETAISIVVLRFASGGAAADADTYYEAVFHGNGFGDLAGGGLRELRHTYWGEADNSGYIFYPNAKLICDAFKHLNRWFDLD